jgi:hypothetical protein
VSGGPNRELDVESLELLHDHVVRELGCRDDAQEVVGLLALLDRVDARLAEERGRPSLARRQQLASERRLGG